MANETMLKRLDAWWRASNYLSAGQLYLLENPLLRETVPGQNFIYTHLNRIINQYDLNMIYLSGPGHGGTALHHPQGHPMAPPLWHHRKGGMPMRGFDELYHTHGKPVYRFLLALTGDEGQAEELLQETFYQASSTSTASRGAAACTPGCAASAKTPGCASAAAGAATPTPPTRS